MHWNTPFSNVCLIFHTQQRHLWGPADRIFSPFHATAFNEARKNAWLKWTILNSQVFNEIYGPYECTRNDLFAFKTIEKWVTLLFSFLPIFSVWFCGDFRRGYRLGTVALHRSRGATCQSNQSRETEKPAHKTQFPAVFLVTFYSRHGNGVALVTSIGRRTPRWEWKTL